MTSAFPISERVLATFNLAGKVLRPPPKLTVSAWAERERVLSSETSAEVGRYRVARAPYQRAMQDAIHIPGVEQITFFTSAQIGKSMCLENISGYFAAEDPCPMIFMWPTDDVAKSWSGDTLAPILRDTPVLARLFDVGARKGASKTLFKKFPGGWMSIIGANSAAGLRRRRARVIICDEVDGYPRSAASEGDPILLVWKRATTFWNRLLVLSSTCTVKGDSRIEASYESSNRQKYFVPCPHCSEAAGSLDGFQVLKWKRLILDKEPPHTNCEYPCEHCGVVLTELDKQWMLENGEWRAERPGVHKHQGFWINELYSPFVTWSQMAEQFFYAVQHRENPELLKTFVNLSLAETWEDEGLKLDATELMERREAYPPPALPDGVTVLTCGVDVQQDRVELEVVGWGKGEENWSVDFLRFDGVTASLEGTRDKDGTYWPSAWEKLEKWLPNVQYLHARGIRLGLAATLVDSGHAAQVVYAFTKKMQDAGLRCYATKGVPGFGRPPLGKWSKQSRNKVKLFPVGVDVIKENIYARLRIKDPGAGYMHFSKEKNDADFFAQLTAEKLDRKYVHGFPTRVWVLPAGKRNEALDCRVYATAAFLSLHSRPAEMLKDLREDLLLRAKYAAQDRRQKVPSGQMPLLEMEPTATTAVALAEALQTSADAPPVPPPEEPEAAGLGAEEYRVAEQLDEKQEAPAPEAPRGIVRRGGGRGGWL